MTQCSMRHLYSTQSHLIDQAKTYERRRCNHHTFDEPLGTLQCLSDVVGGSNKHRYVVASQDAEVRSSMRLIPGVPMVYINRSVMIMEPMAASTETVRDQEERQKFRSGLVRKRKRDEGKQVKKRGPKEPNPLSVKRSKMSDQSTTKTEQSNKRPTESEPVQRKRRKRKHGSGKPELSESGKENIRAN
jgi:U3 small nucleolar RNA-associated protein 23